VSWTDFKKFESACRDSKKELTEFLSMGEYMSQYISMDYWNLFGALLKSKELDLYGLYHETKLLGVASMYHSSRPFGCQLVYWIRGGYHGKGLGKYFLFQLLTVALGRKNFLFAELIIDEENKASVSVAEALQLDLIHRWERPQSGQGIMNSGKFRLYFAFENIFRCEAEQANVLPIELLDFFWHQWDKGIDMRMFLPKASMPEKRTTLRDTLRLADGSIPKKGSIKPDEDEPEEPRKEEGKEPDRGNGDKAT